MPEEPSTIWTRVREELRRDLPEFKFHIWLEPLELAAIDGHTLFVRAPDHIRTWVTERYLPLLRSAAQRAVDPLAVVEIVGADWDGPNAGIRTPADTSVATTIALNPRHTFREFVIGPGNRFAHAAALAVAELPGQAYNPLFLHGPPGLGKTHLLHAVGNYVQAYGGGLIVRYATVEEFTSEFVSALRAGDTAAFKRGFRDADVVLIDDVQFLANKAATGEELFHTFNTLTASGRQLVLTSDCSPAELEQVDIRLTERFASGLTVELQPPSIEVRRVILAKRAALDGHDVSEDVLERIAELVTSSVRALESALVRVVAYSSLAGERATPELAQRLLERLHYAGAPRVPSIDEVIDATARELGVNAEAVRARGRTPPVVTARQTAMYLARELTSPRLRQPQPHDGAPRDSARRRANSRGCAGPSHRGLPAHPPVRGRVPAAVTARIHSLTTLRSTGFLRSVKPDGSRNAHTDNAYFLN